MSKKLITTCDICKKEIIDNQDSTSYRLEKKRGIFKPTPMDICSECMDHIISYIGIPHQKSIPPMNGNVAQDR